MRQVNNAGFSLLELAIVLTILSVLTGTIITLIPIQQAQKAQQDLDFKLNKIQIALDNFTGQYGRLPCPAIRTLAKEDANFGVETDCSLASILGTVEITGLTTNENLRTGVIPTRSLNLPDEYMFDSWNNRIDYTVVKSLATTLNAFSNYSTSQNDTILIKDIANNRINRMNNSSTPNFVAYVFLSHGQNNSGAASYLGNAYACPTFGADVQNCNNDYIFIDDAFNSSNSNFFDDYVRWKTYQSLVRDSGLSPKINTVMGTVGFRKYGLFTHTLLVGGGGNSNTSSWNIRQLNTQKYSTLDNATLSNNILTLGQGTYILKAKAVANKVDGHKLRIYNVTSNQTLAVGIATSSDSTSTNGNQTLAIVEAYIEINSPTSFRIDHFTETAAVNGLGRAVMSLSDAQYDLVSLEVFSK